MRRTPFALFGRSGVVMRTHWCHARNLASSALLQSGDVKTGGSAGLTPAFPANLRVYVSPSTDPFWNVAFEDWLFRNLAVSEEMALLLWRNAPSVVIGRNQNPWIECNMRRMERDSVALVRRRSGGGTVYHDLGNLNCTLLFPRDDFRRDRLTSFLVHSLNEAWPGLGLAVNDRNDIVQGKFKVSGSAYKLGGRCAYHHLTLLFDADMQRLGRYLRSHRAHTIVAGGTPSVRSPVCNIVAPGAGAGSNGEGGELSYDAICDAIIGAFERPAAGSQSPGALLLAGRQLVRKDTPAAPSELAAVDEHVTDLRSWEWLYGQTPRFTQQLSHRFSWGSVSVELECHKGAVSALAVTFEAPPVAAGEQLPAGIQAAITRLLQPLVGTRYAPDLVAQMLAPDVVLTAAAAAASEDGARAPAAARDEEESVVKLHELQRWLAKSL